MSVGHSFRRDSGHRTLAEIQPVSVRNAATVQPQVEPLGVSRKPNEPVAIDDPPASTRRRYDSPLRRQRTDETRRRIVAGGAELAHSLPSGDWRGLTFRAVGERAGVSERTVHRHFATERELRAAVLQRLVEEAGVSLDRLGLGDFAGVAARVFAYLSSFAVSPAPKEPAFVALDHHRRNALLDAVAHAAPAWPDARCRMAAAVLDAFWNVATYERLVAGWGLDTPEVGQAITWAIGLIERAIREDRGP
jgi:AcrR family transcriptional regulator